MANEEHLEILKQGGEAWNNWRTNNPEVTLDLSGANLSQAYLTTILLPRANLCKANLSQAIINGTNLYRANLSGAFACRASFYLSDLREADLSSADFSEANLSQVYLRGANVTGAILKEVNFRGADLRDANLSRANLTEANLKGANLSGANLSGANLSEANLRDAILSGTNTNLSGANLSGANLKGAQVSEVDLTGVGLIETQALETNFSRATFTGACIKDWNINNVTNLDSVTCDYVFLKEFQQERRPHTGNFAYGDFKKIVQDSLDTVDLIFNEGVNWKAFTYSFHNTQVENEGTPLAIRSIENKGDGVVLIRVTVPPDSDKCKIHAGFIQGYEFAQKALEFQYQARSEDKDKEINRLFYLVNQLQTKLGKGLTLMAEQSKYDQRGAKISIGSYVDTAQSGSRQQGQAIQHNYAPEQKQTLAEAAEEIQKLLKQLEQTNPTATEAEKVAFVNDETSPSFKRRVVGALKAVGEAAIDEFVLENKSLKVMKEAFKGWMKPE